MSSFTTSALETLQQYEMDPHHLLRLLHKEKKTRSYMNMETQTQWTFMARQRSHLFLLAKPDDESCKYQDILSVRPL